MGAIIFFLKNIPGKKLVNLHENGYHFEERHFGVFLPLFMGVN
jgi:hypothetical protein